MVSLYVPMEYVNCKRLDECRVHDVLDTFLFRYGYILQEVLSLVFFVVGQ